jgi:ribosomal-protein-alanine N-acetyltransferase
MPTPAFPTLETPRLWLREIVASDAPALFQIHGDAHTMRWFGNDPLPDLAAALKLVDTFAGWRALPNPGTRWAIVPKAGGLGDAPPPLAGTCGLFGWNRAWRKCTLGYELAPAWQGQGLMNEALQACIAWGFAHMDLLNRIEAQVHPSNAASISVLRRLGFAPEGLHRQLGYWAGQHHDMQSWALLRQDANPALAPTTT